MKQPEKTRHFDKDSVKREKIRLIFFPFLLLALGVIILCSVLYWYFVIEKGMDRGNGVAVVLIAALVPFLILRRINLIENRKEGLNRLFWFLCAMAVMVPTVLIQFYIDKSVGRLTRLNDLTEIESHPPSRFYIVEQPVHTANLSIRFFTWINSAGSKTRDKRLNTYCVAPLLSDTHYSNEGVWLGQTYRSNSFHPKREQEMLNSFVPTSVERFERETGRSFKYLERIILTEKSGYSRALGVSSDWPRKPVVLVPHYVPFEERAGNSLNSALLVFVIGMGLVLAVVLFLPFNEKRLHCFLTGERYSDVPCRKPSKTVKGKKTVNDKLIVVRGITRQKMESDLKEVCDLYNGDGGQMHPELRQTGDTEFVITFPYNIDFEPFCFLINFLCYPVSGGDRAEVTGWTKAAAGEPWITGEISGKELMLYVPEEDRECDNVYVTTAYGECYKFGFDGGTFPQTKQYLPYRKPAVPRTQPAETGSGRRPESNGERKTSHGNLPRHHQRG